MIVPVGHCQGNSGTDSYVAKAGKIFISESEFIERYELTAGIGGRVQAQQDIEKQELLYSIIAEKLLAQEALERKLDKDTVYEQANANVRKMLSRDELYRREIIRKVTVTSRERDLGIWRAQRELKLQYLFFEKEEEARFIKARLRNANSISRLRIDSTISALRDTATLIWGEADPVIEDAAYQLKMGRVSPVLSAGEGFYIITVKSIKRNARYASMQPEQILNKVETILRARKEKERLDIFLDEILKDKKGYGRPEFIRVLSRSLSTILAEEPVDSVYTITPDIERRVRRICEQSLHEPLAVAGKESWSLENVLDRLASSGFQITDREPRRIFAKLNAQLKIWTQQELLSQTAIDRQLDQVPAVSRKIEMWSQHFLAEQLKQDMRNTITCSDAEIWSFMKQGDSTLAVPMVRIRELRTATVSDMSGAISDLDQKKSFEETIAKWSNDPRAKVTGGLTEYFPIFSRQPVGTIAWNMKIGERYGPITLHHEPMMFELVDKKNPFEASDTGFASRFNAAKDEVLKLKQRGVLNMFIAKLGRQMGFSIFQERLDRIKLTPLPMVTFRILGFGGRMFATPVVPRQFDWINIENPETVPLP